MTESSRPIRAGLFVAGSIGLYVYLRFLANDVHAFTIMPYGGSPNFLYLSPGETRLMLMHSLVGLPSVLAMTLAFSRRLAAMTDARLRRWAKSDPKQFRTAALAFTLILLSLYRIGRSLLLRDLPITDDENAIEFGAQIIAAGQLTAPVLEPQGAFSDLFLHIKDGRVASFDWPGGLLFRALALKTGFADYAYALFAAIGGTAVVATAHRLLGARGGFLAAVVFVASPLAIGISMTAHAHVVARTFVAVAVWAHVDSVLESDRRSARDNLLRGALLGAAVGGAFLTRPFESAALLGPIGLHALWRAYRGPASSRRLVLGALVTFAGALAIFAWFNAGTTGKFWLPTRFDRANIVANFLPAMSLDERVAKHVAYNLPLLGVYAIGALGLPVAVVGMLSGKRLLLLVGLGFVASLALMLGHQNVGIHVIGPIHYSEATVPLTLLFVAGVGKIGDVLAPAIPPAVVVAATFGYLVGVAALFTVPWLAQLQRHGEFVARPHDFLAEQDIHNAIVLAPPRTATASPTSIGSWQLSMPHPDPFLRADIEFALPTANPDALHAAHPGRHIYRLTAGAGGTLVLLHLYEPSS